MVVDGCLTGRNLHGDAFGVYEWVWDTTGLIGEHAVEVRLDPRDRLISGDENGDNNSLLVVVEVQTPVSAAATWVSVATQYANVYAISGTAAARDLPYLSGEVDRAI